MRMRASHLHRGHWYKRVCEIGVTYVDVMVRNPAHRSRVWTGAFLVETSAIDSLMPRRSLEAIGLKLTGRQTYATADGREVEIDVTVGE